MLSQLKAVKLIVEEIHSLPDSFAKTLQSRMTVASTPAVKKLNIKLGYLLSGGREGLEKNIVGYKQNVQPCYLSVVAINVTFSQGRPVCILLF